MVGQVGLADSIAFIENNPHPKLWKLVADASLETMDLDVCQKAFIRSGDYQGLQLVKKLKKLDVSIYPNILPG
jgi:WD repeat-containing protein 35